MITFNNIPQNMRTPGTYIEIDNSRALKGLIQNPHKVLIVGQKLGSSGTAAFDTLMAISRDSLADGFFGQGSILARMCNKFKENNPNTELYAMAIGSGVGGTAAEATIDFSGAMVDTTASKDYTYYFMVNGQEIEVDITSNMSGGAIVSHIVSLVNSYYSWLPVNAAVGASRGRLVLSAKCSGTLGNYISIIENYYGTQIPSCFSWSAAVAGFTKGSGVAGAKSFFTSFTGGATDPTLADVWAVIDNEQFHYIIQPYTATAQLAEIEGELEDRFLPLNDLQGHGFTAICESYAGLTSTGNARNSPHNTIIGAQNAPNTSEEWAAALGAVAAWNLNNDPARPLHYLKLKGILPPLLSDRFTRAERDILLYDGIATWIVDSGGNVLIERCITTYQKTAFGSLDPSYLDIQTLATLGEIRYQYKSRMATRFIIPRFKLADNNFPVQPGSNVVTPNVVKQETIALFTMLRDRGLIENLDEFIENLVVERDTTDVNRINCLLSPDLINQFRILAGNIQFIL
jgi:phage tail sheath gpL-like